MTDNKKAKLIQLIHIGKNKLGLTDDDYRTFIESLTGEKSCSDMNVFQLEEVLKKMKKLGFRIKKMPLRKNEIGRASAAKLRYIKGMWEVCARVKTDVALNNFIKRITGVANIKWLDDPNAQKVILALRKMMIQGGYNPDTKEGA